MSQIAGHKNKLTNPEVVTRYLRANARDAEFIGFHSGFFALTLHTARWSGRGLPLPCAEITPKRRPDVGIGIRADIRAADEYSVGFRNQKAPRRECDTLAAAAIKVCLPRQIGPRLCLPLAHGNPRFEPLSSLHHR